MTRLASLTLAAMVLAVMGTGRAPAQQQARVVDGISAIVNQDVITISQLRELIGARERALREVFRGEELTEKLNQLRLSALKDLIDRQLILQEFEKMKEQGAQIPEYVVDDRVQTIIREEFGGDRAAFVRTLQAQGYTLTRFKEIEREKIIVQAMRQSKMSDNFVISPAQIQRYYNENKTNFTTPEQVKLRMIVIREGEVGDILTGANKRQVAEEIRQKLLEGADFDRMAQMYSEDPSTQEVGGDWGWIERNTLTDNLSRVAFSLKPGEVSPVVPLDGAYYILMVEARKNAQVKPVADVRDEIERNLIQQERRKAQELWLDTLRQKAYIKIL
jgi:peptidyl-prolyl cis-trans isomerase SurA